MNRTFLADLYDEDGTYLRTQEIRRTTLEAASFEIAARLEDYNPTVQISASTPADIRTSDVYSEAGHLLATVY